MINAEPYLPVGEVVEGDNLDVMARMPDNSIDAIVTDPPYGLEFMGKEWDKLGWQGGGGFSKPGIGERDTAWPSFSATSRFGTANPTCATCGGRLRGAKKCSCETPDWQPIGKRRNAENEGLPDDMTGGGMTRQMSGMQEWHERWAREAYRIAKPGAYLLAFGGTRTYHRLASAIEDAGWEIRDTLVWAYASGFPKSLDVSKAIDKAAGAEREVVGQRTLKGNAAVSTQEKGGTYVAGANFTGVKDIDVTTAATDDAKKWAGWGTALKPAWEPIVMARKPLSGTVASNVLRYGTGAINIDATRIQTEENLNGGAYAEDPTERWDGTENWRYKRGIGRSTLPGDEREGAALGMLAEGKVTGKEFVQPEGRWPANVILTDPILDGGFEGVVGGGERASGVMKGGTQRNSRSVDYGKMPDTATLSDTYGDSGGASRFFLIPKASRSSREPNWHGLQEEFEDEDPTNSVGPMAGRGQPGMRCLKCGKWKVSGSPCVCPEPEWEQVAFNRPRIFNNHTTVKPVDLMVHLVRMVCPPDGIVLDMFLGSGTTAKAAELEGRKWIGIEQDPHYCKIARARLSGTQKGLGL